MKRSISYPGNVHLFSQSASLGASPKGRDCRLTQGTQLSPYFHFDVEPSEKLLTTVYAPAYNCILDTTENRTNSYNILSYLFSTILIESFYSKFVYYTSI